MGRSEQSPSHIPDRESRIAKIAADPYIRFVTAKLKSSEPIDHPEVPDEAGWQAEMIEHVDETFDEPPKLVDAGLFAAEIAAERASNRGQT